MDPCGRYILVEIMESYFKIKNLTCGYSSSNPVFYLDELELPRGSMVFIVGVSGSGKSTFLETLALMNNTQIGKATTFEFHSLVHDSVVSFDQLWKTGLDQMDNIRSKSFSFLFQNTNLMPNFSAGENMCISAYIQGIEERIVKAEVLKNMDELGLPRTIYDKKVKHLSGGQQQRVAFIRAICREFEILFGDEPTGNLDPISANILMEILRKKVIEKQVTAVIVSHDLSLAIKYGDMIVPIAIENNLGFISQDKIYHKKENGWEKKKNRINDMYNELAGIIKQKNES